MEWNRLDKFIAYIRYRKIDKYVPKGGVICDIGCGRHAEFLRRHSRTIKKGYGIDFRISSMKTGNIELFNNRERKCFPVNTESCDAVFMLAVLEHLDSPSEMLKNIKSILKDDGKLVLTTPTTPAKPILEFMAFKLHIMNEEEILEHKHYYNKKEILSLLKKNGFVDIHYKKFCFGVNSVATAIK